MTSVRLVSITAPEVDGVSDPEQLIVYCARVSNPSNQLNTATAPALLKYLIEHKHWSPFEMVNVTMEIETSRAIAAQILRHRSFAFQEFSQRYAPVDALATGAGAGVEFEPIAWRKQGKTNRQASSEDVSQDEAVWLSVAWGALQARAKWLYDAALEKGVAREVARLVLPLSVKTRLYMNGSLRSWIHYLDARCAPETQQEHRDVAITARSLLAARFPNVAGVLGWFLLPAAPVDGGA